MKPLVDDASAQKPKTSLKTTDAAPNNRMGDLQWRNLSKDRSSEFVMKIV